MKRSALPVLVVARSDLGTINHSLLTLEALRSRSIPIAGLVINRLSGEPRPEEAANPQQIEQFAGDVVLGTLPFFGEAQTQDFDYLAQRMETHVDVDRLLADST
jgi:dethiobiotin synthetase